MSVIEEVIVCQKQINIFQPDYQIRELGKCIFEYSKWESVSTDTKVTLYHMLTVAFLSICRDNTI